MEALKELLQLIQTPAFLLVFKTVLSCWVIAALIGGWEKPDPADHPRWFCYVWRVSQLIAANLKAALKALHIPGAGE